MFITLAVKMVTLFFISLFFYLISKKAIFSSLLSFAFCFFMEILFHLDYVFPVFIRNSAMLSFIRQIPLLENIYGGVFRPAYFIMYYMGFGLSVVILKAINKKELVLNFPKKRNIIFLSSFLIGFFVLLLAFSNKLDVSRYDIEIAKLPPSLENIKIVHISDLHSTIFPNNQQSLIDEIEKQNPDLIFLTGDIADDSMPFLGTQLLLEGIKDIAPIYYVPGNHEYWATDFYEVNEKIRSFGVVSLEDSFDSIYINGEEIFIFGLDDPDCSFKKKNSLPVEKRIQILNAQASPNNINLLLSHRPKLANLYKDTNFDVVFSGHVHGGQVRLPFTNMSLIGPDEGFCPKYSAGVYPFEHNSMVVSRGLSVSENLPRIFNPPDLVVVTLKNKQP